MSRFHSYLNSAKGILENYKGEEPFSIFLKDFFQKNKKYGSSDRKFISHLCYSFFRTGHAFDNMSKEEKILLSLFLCIDQPDPFLEFHRPDLNGRTALNVHEKLHLLQREDLSTELFPFQNEISPELDKDKFVLSHLSQPNLFLRSRPGYSELVAGKLSQAGIDFTKYSDDCFALKNSVKVETIINLDKEAVVQDFNSQRVGEILLPIKPAFTDKKINIWDCCAASGGKSILAKDIFSDPDLTVSDIRTSILVNLKKRFSNAGIQKFSSYELDLTKPAGGLKEKNFDLVIADVPCTGSGTWSRTPEQMYFFDEKKIDEFCLLQRKIMENVLPHLKESGYFLYITCSVFEKENEKNVEWLKDNFRLELLEQKYFKGYDVKADTLFVGVFGG